MNLLFVSRIEPRLYVRLYRSDILKFISTFCGDY